MAILTEGSRAAQFLVSEANGWRSRDAAIVTVPASTTFAAGTVLGRQTSGGKYVRHDTDGTDDGRRVAVAVLVAPATNDTLSAVDVDAAVIVRSAEVTAADLTYEDGANDAAKVIANTAMAAVGIIAR